LGGAGGSFQVVPSLFKKSICKKGLKKNTSREPTGLPRLEGKGGFQTLFKAKTIKGAWENSTPVSTKQGLALLMEKQPVLAAILLKKGPREVPSGGGG